MNSFLLLVNTVTYTNAQKEETMELVVQIYLEIFYILAVAVITNLIAFFLFLFENFSFLVPDPIPGGKMNADPDLQPFS